MCIHGLYNRKKLSETKIMNMGYLDTLIIKLHANFELGLSIYRGIGKGAKPPPIIQLLQRAGSLCPPAVSLRSTHGGGFAPLPPHLQMLRPSSKFACSFIISVSSYPIFMIFVSYNFFYVKQAMNENFSLLCIRVSQNAPKCSLESDIVHVAVSTPQESPKHFW